MDPAHIHLLLNHVPLISILIGFFLLSAGLLFRKDDLKTAALILFFAAGLLTIPVYLTGEGAEERIEDFPGVTENWIHNHEEAAEFALIAVLVLGGVSFVGFLAGPEHPKIYVPVVLIALAGSLFAEAVMARTAYLGGQIRHTEIRPSDQSAHTGDPD